MISKIDRDENREKAGGVPGYAGWVERNTGREEGRGAWGTEERDEKMESGKKCHLFFFLAMMKIKMRVVLRCRTLALNVRGPEWCGLEATRGHGEVREKGQI